MIYFLFINNFNNYYIYFSTKLYFISEFFFNIVHSTIGKFIIKRKQDSEQNINDGVSTSGNSSNYVAINMFLKENKILRSKIRKINKQYLRDI